MKKREFLKTTATLASSALLPTSLLGFSSKAERLRTAHIGVGGMGGADLASISSHPSVDVVALCDVDSEKLAAAKKIIPKPKLTKIIG